MSTRKVLKHAIIRENMSREIKKNHEFAEEEVALVKKKSIPENMSTRKLSSF